MDVRVDVGLIRALLFGVQYETNLLDGVQRTLEDVVGRKVLGATPAQYLNGIRGALASTMELSKLLPMALEPSETQVRDFLAEIARRLEA